MIDKFIETVKEHSVDKGDFFSMVALCGEVGELANVIKKAEFYIMFDKYKKRVDDEINKGTRKSFREQFIDEAGDVFFYFIQLIDFWDITLEEVIEYQTNKLKNQDKELGRIFKK